MHHFEIFRRERRAGHEYVAARFWRTKGDFRADKPPAIINDFRLQLRRDHQRIRRGPRGGLLHRSGAEVSPAELRDFVLSSGDAIDWQRDARGRVKTDATGRWRRRRGPALTPFKLGRETFDPQWQREAFATAADDPIAAELAAYARRAFAAGWSGDRRGTTSIYQVGASSDDGYVNSLEEWRADLAQVLIGDSPAYSDVCEGWYRFTGVSGLSPATTINSAILSLWGAAADTGTPNTILSFDLSAESPAHPTSYSNYYSVHNVHTTNVAWNAPGLSTSDWTDSPELASSLQEVFTVHGYTPSTLQVLHGIPGPQDGHYLLAASYDADTSHAAKLTIDHSTPSFRRRAAASRPIYRP